MFFHSDWWQDALFRAIMREIHRIGGNRHRLGGNGYAIWWQDTRIGGDRVLVAKCRNWWRGVMFFHSDWWQDALFRAIMREIHRIGGNRHRLGSNGYAIWWQDTRIGGDRVLVAKCRNWWRGVMFFHSDWWQVTDFGGAICVLCDPDLSI
jgi:hypothetical protein